VRSRSLARRTALFAVGFRPGDVVLNTFSYHLTRRLHLRRLGARARCAVNSGRPGNTEAQFELIEAYRPVGYSGTPDFLKILLDAAASAGRDVSRSSARWCQAPPFRNRCRTRSDRAASMPIRRSGPPISAWSRSRRRARRHWWSTRT